MKEIRQFTQALSCNGIDATYISENEIIISNKTIIIKANYIQFGSIKGRFTGPEDLLKLLTNGGALNLSHGDYESVLMNYRYLVRQCTVNDDMAK